MKKFGNIEIGKTLLFIIEEGQFNLGNFEKAIQFIELAGMTGANAIEFQLAYADDFYVKSEPGHGIYKTREFDDVQLSSLVAHSKKNGLEFVATCLSHKLVPKMASYGCSGFNLNASDINNTAIIDAILKTKLPFFISLPLADEEEIKWTINYILKNSPDAEFGFLHGQHSMASGKESVDVADTSLGFIKTLMNKSDRPVGFIDHTMTPWVASVAVAAGAVFVSKHMTISHLYKGPDWQICLSPEQMQACVSMAQEVWKSISNKEKVLASDELIDRSVMRRSIVSSRKILKGDIISSDDISFKRPGTGIAPSLAETVIGKIAAQDIDIDVLFTNKMTIE